MTDKLVEAMARSDAAFDGRTFDALGRADKNRYLNRCAAALAIVRPFIVEECAKIATKASAYDVGDGPNNDFRQGFYFGCLHVAEAISAAAYGGEND